MKRPLPPRCQCRVSAKLNVAGSGREQGAGQGGAQQAAAGEIGGEVHARFLSGAGTGRHQQEREGLGAVGSALDLLARPRPGAGPGSVRRVLRASMRASRAGRPGATPIRAASTVPRGPAISARSGQPAGDGAACGRWPRPHAGHQHAGRRAAPARHARASTRALDTTNSSGVFSLAAGSARPSGWRSARGRSAEAGRRCGGIAPRGSRPAPAAARRRRSGAPAWWRGSALSRVARGRRAWRATPGAFAVAAAEHRLAPRLVPYRGSKGRAAASLRGATRQPVSTAAKAVTSVCV